MWFPFQRKDMQMTLVDQRKGELGQAFFSPKVANQLLWEANKSIGMTAITKEQTHGHSYYLLYYAEFVFPFHYVWSTGVIQFFGTKR